MKLKGYNLYKDIKQRILINASYRYRVQIVTMYIINTIFQVKVQQSKIFPQKLIEYFLEFHYT